MWIDVKWCIIDGQCWRQSGKYGSVTIRSVQNIFVPKLGIINNNSKSTTNSQNSRSRDSSPIAESHQGYSCGTCDTVAATRPALRKHILESHPGSSSSESSGARRCPSSSCEFSSNSRCEMESHVAAHVAQGMTPSGKKRSLALQRVRYRYSKFHAHFSLYLYIFFWTWILA